MPGYKKRAKHKSTTSKKHKKPKRVLRSTNEEKMVESCSDSGESDASDDEAKIIHEDTQMLEFEDTRYNIKYITIKMTLDTNANAIEALREKYTILKTTLLEADETVIFLPINPKKKRRPSKTGRRNSSQNDWYQHILPFNFAITKT